MSPGAETGVLSRDTSREAEALQVRTWRSLSTLVLAGLISRTSRAIRSVAAAGVRQRYPDMADAELVSHVAAITLGPELAERAYRDVRRSYPDTTLVNDPITVALVVIAALEACGSRYSIGGSIASSFSGEPRASIDVDLLVDLQAGEVERFAELLGDDFYVDPDALRRAISMRSSTNLVHRPSGIKVDLFVANSRLDALQLARRQLVQVPSFAERSIYIHSPEDILLQKLHWYRMGAGVSDRQWRDALAIILVQGVKLDRGALSATSVEEGLSDLLERAYEQAGRVD